MESKVTERFQQSEKVKVMLSKERSNLDQKCNQLTPEVGVLHHEARLFQNQAQADQEKIHSLSKQLTKVNYRADLKARLVEDEC